MSSRFNPVALLTRRRSKSKTKSQSESVHATSVKSPTEVGPSSPKIESIEPRVTSKPARASASCDFPSSPRLRFRVFTSFRRERSPRRRSEKEPSDGARAISVPPKMRTNEHSPTTDVPPPPSIQKLNDEIRSAEAPAPLAQHDCFELTDVSDVEHEDLQSKRQRLIGQTSSTEHNGLQSQFIESPQSRTTTENVDKTDLQSQKPTAQEMQQKERPSLSRLSTKGSDEDDLVPRSLADTGDDTEEEDTWQSERLSRSVTVDSVDDSSVTKLSVEYETEYPVCENTDSTLSPPQSPLNEDWATVPDNNSSDSEYVDGGLASDRSTSLSEKSLDEEEIQEKAEPTGYEFESGKQVMSDQGSTVAMYESSQETGKCGVKVNVIPAESDSDHCQDDVDRQQIESKTDATDTGAYDQEIEQEEYMESQFEVEPDPEQDPFYAVELAAAESNDQSTILTAPSIIVTSASTGSLHWISEPQPTPPAPERPPPPPKTTTSFPTEDTVPKRPPPPPVAPPMTTGPPPSRPPPTRPLDSTASDHAGQQHKKKKLFGVMDLGPLPSDPDPNFPFRKHLDKSVVPNPRKAIQRIIRGETKAERRQRKEQEELSRLLKTTPNEPVKPVSETHSKDWEEFQKLTAQIKHTVQESVSKVQEFAPIETDSGSKSDENWAQFETVFGQSARGLDLEEDGSGLADGATVIQSENPWEQGETKPTESSFFETAFNQAPDENWGDPDKPVVEDLFASQPAIVQEVPVYDTLLPTDLDIDFEFESLRGSPGEKITQDIDAFLGIEDPRTVEPTTETLVSDPLKLLEKLKPKPEDNPLEDFGMIAPQKEVTEQICESNTTQYVPREELTEPVQSEEKRNVLDDEVDTVVQEASDPDEVNSPEVNELEIPINAVEDTSDIDDPVDDILWGGFSEVRVSSSELPNPFSGDDFSVLPTATVEHKTSLESKAQQADEQLKAIARPRNKPVRQETLSGNNPFRKRTDLDGNEEEGDELTRAAAGIELIVVKKSGSHKIHDSFESSGSSVELDTGLTLKPVADDTYDTTIEPQDIQQVSESGFDPLQTIYPESENESVASEEHDKKSKEPALSITINQLSEEPKSETDDSGSIVPTIQAPPENLRQTRKDMVTEPVENKAEDSEVADIFKNEVPAGWVDFNEEPAEPIDKPILSADEAFNVDWAAAASTAQPAEPEPPRPDTPDPELDIPFNPPTEDDAFYRLWLRYPEKKTRVKQMSKYTTDRYWREVAIHFTIDHDRKLINIHEVDENSGQISPEPYRSIRIEPYMQLSREKLQQYDKYGKLHVFKLNHVSYRELVGIRPEKFSIKTLQHLVTHKPKQNVAVDHLPVYTEVLKFGSLDQSRVRQLMPVFEDALMKIPAHKDTTLNYSREEVCCYVVDEYQGHVSATGTIEEQKARTRILCTAFVNGGPHIILGLNDKWRFGREVVRRADILPVMHDDWISIRKPEFHSCVEMDAYEKDHMLKFYPLDGCRFELLRFRVSLRGNRELPLQLKCVYSIDGRRVSMRCELLVPGFFSACNRKGAVPCENVEIHIPVPEDWIYHFRVEKHHKYGSVHSTLRKPGRIKGLERITQMAQSLLPPSILEASIGLAKYEHLYKAVVWRIPRIPEKSEASFRPHLLTCKMNLAAHDNVPEWETLVPDCQVEYTMPSSTVSGATVRSISVEHTGVAEKFVKYTSKYRYTVGIDYQLGARKEPMLKGILDEVPPTNGVEHVDNKVHEIITQENHDMHGENHTEQPPPTGEVADLLGLGLGFGQTVAESEPDHDQQDATKFPSGENPVDLF